MNLAVWSCFPFSSEKHYSVKNCENNINTALKFITETNSIKVVVLSGYWGYLSSGGFEIENQNYKQPNALTKRQSESFVQAGIRVLDALGKSEKRIIFMRDTPDLDFNIQSCFDMTPFKRNNIRQDCFMSYTGYLNRYQEFDSLLLSLTNKYPALEIYSPTKLFCSNKTNTCRAKENADPLYYNSDHLTLKGSDLVIQDMLKQYPVN